MNWKQSLGRYLTDNPNDELDSWHEKCQSLIVYPEDTQEFDNLVDVMLTRMENTHSAEQAASIVSRQLNILYYRRHPREDLKLLQFIL